MVAPRSDPYPHVSFVESYAPDGWVIVKLGGQLDAESRPSIEAKLHLLAESADATVDLSRTASIDLGSVRMLVACQERARLHGHSLRIENAPPYVERMLEMLQRGQYWRPGKTLGDRGEGDSYQVPPPTTPDAQRSQPESVQIVRLQCPACGDQTFRPETAPTRICENCGAALDLVAVFRDRRRLTEQVENDRRRN